MVRLQLAWGRGRRQCSGLVPAASGVRDVGPLLQVVDGRKVGGLVSRRTIGVAGYCCAWVSVGNFKAPCKMRVGGLPTSQASSICAAVLLGMAYALTAVCKCPVQCPRARADCTRQRVCGVFGFWEVVIVCALGALDHQA